MSGPDDLLIGPVTLGDFSAAVDRVCGLLEEIRDANYPPDYVQEGVDNELLKRIAGDIERALVHLERRP